MLMQAIFQTGFCGGKKKKKQSLNAAFWFSGKPWKVISAYSRNIDAGMTL